MDYTPRFERADSGRAEDLTAMPLTPPPARPSASAGERSRSPTSPIVPYVEGDGTGRDIWRASQRVFDAAVEKAYGGKRKIAWMEVLAGEKAFNQTKEWMPAETLDAFREYLVGIKGPLTTPVGGGIRSLNVALRQELDLYVCLRPVRYFKGVPSPVKRPEDVDMVIFRENTEDIYAGVEWAAGTPEVQKVLPFLQTEMKVKKIRFPETSAIGIKPISQRGHRAPGARRPPARARVQAQEPDPRAQGQHHEVHGRGLPRLGLRPGRARVPRRDRHRARELDPRQQGEGRAR